MSLRRHEEPTARDWCLNKWQRSNRAEASSYSWGLNLALIDGGVELNGSLNLHQSIGPVDSHQLMAFDLTLKWWSVVSQYAAGCL